MSSSAIDKAVARLRRLAAKTGALDTPDAGRGFLRNATRLQREAYKQHKAASHTTDTLAYKILSMPATSPADMLLKIEAAGLLIDRTDSADTVLKNLANWQPDLSGGVCDNAAPALIVALRKDITQLFGEDHS